MTRIKSLLAAAAAAAIVAVVPAASAQSVHFVGAGSSAQFLMAAIAADQAALNANSALYGNADTVQHWTKKSAATVNDNRDSLGRITPEPGNIWLVWIQDGSGNIKDVWTDVSVDSTVGVRAFSAQENIGGVQVSGAQIQISSAALTASDNLVSPTSLWPDNSADVPVTQNALNSINTSVSGGVHVNVGLTDIRPEDALFATTRAIAALNTTTYAGLGYVGPTGNIGAPINTDQGTGTNATPIKFALQGKGDPFKTAFIVPAYTTIPIGAAPIVFISNNGGSSPLVTNLVSGVTPGAHVAGQTYPASDLFGGKVSCDSDSLAFGGNGDGAGTAMTLFLREPLSGTMNATEFSLFRTTGNTTATQENGVINPTRSPYNPMALGCPGKGIRVRAIGTGEVVGKAGSFGVLNTPASLGYIFWGFGNASKLTGSGFNYLTLDGVDPLGLGTPNQGFPNCSTTTCPVSLWPGSNSFPTLRDGTYKAWSIYRWLAVPTSDPYGPTVVAQLAQNYVDNDVADFVPFVACPLADPTCTSSNPTDGLSVYHSHFTQASVVGNNGLATAVNTFNNGNALGGGTEAGGDEGGLIEGPFGITDSTTNGYVTWATTITAGKGYKVTWKQGAHFTAGALWKGSPITVGGTSQMVASCTSCTPTITVLYVANPNPSGSATIQTSYSAPFSITYGPATAPGVISKKQ